MNWLLVLAALAIGAASALQGATNGALAGRIGLAGTVAVNATVVFVVAIAAWLVSRRTVVAEPAAPWFLYLGGAYGLVVIAGAAFAFPRLGAGPTTALVIAAQLVAALALDHYGVFATKVEATPARLVGAVLLVAGAVLVLWPRLRGQG